MTELIAQRIASIQQRISAACERAGRDPASVRLLPVSKTQPVAAVLAAQAAGIVRFGENRVQEMVAKLDELGPNTDVEFAIIGPLQSNKAGKVAQLAVEFQALESAALAATLDRRLQAAGRSLDVLVEVNTSGEASKFGLAPDQVLDFCRSLGGYPSLRPRGLMTIAAPGPDLARVAACFEMLRGLQTQLRDEQAAGVDWPELSMGMSGDFELAIEHGSTCVRVGTAIFGQRPALV